MSRDSWSVRSSHDSGQVVQIDHDLCVFGEKSKHAQVVYALFVTVFTLTVIYVSIPVSFQITCIYEVVSFVGFGSASNVNDNLNLKKHVYYTIPLFGIRGWIFICKPQHLVLSFLRTRKFHTNSKCCEKVITIELTNNKMHRPLQLQLIFFKTYP